MYYTQLRILTRERAFHSLDNKIVAARIETSGDRIEVGALTPLFDARAPEGFARFFYDVAPGGRFLLAVPPPTTAVGQVNLLVNWRSSWQAADAGCRRAPDIIASPLMPPAPGTRLGSYEITGLLGAGGPAFARRDDSNRVELWRGPAVAQQGPSC